MEFDYFSKEHFSYSSFTKLHDSRNWIKKGFTTMKLNDYFNAHIDNPNFSLLPAQPYIDGKDRRTSLFILLAKTSNKAPGFVEVLSDKDRIAVQICIDDEFRKELNILYVQQLVSDYYMHHSNERIRLLNNTMSLSFIKNHSN